MNIRIVCMALSVLVWSGSCVWANTKILFLGDSLTAGYGLPKEQSFPMLIEQELEAQGYDVTVINAGVSGSTSASALSRLKWFAKQKPTILVLALGANDGLRGSSVENMKKNLAEAIEFAQENQMQVLLAGMKMLPNYGLKYTLSFEKAFKELSKEYDVPLIPFLLEGVAANSKLNLPDGIHPNAKGYQIVAKTVLKDLKPLISK